MVTIDGAVYMDKNTNKSYELEVVKKTNSCFTWLKYFCAQTDSSPVQLWSAIYWGMNVCANKFQQCTPKVDCLPLHLDCVLNGVMIKYMLSSFPFEGHLTFQGCIPLTLLGPEDWGHICPPSLHLKCIIFCFDMICWHLLTFTLWTVGQSVLAALVTFFGLYW